MDRIHWDFCKTEDGTRWHLVLCTGICGKGTVWVPGYESRESGDILHAYLYLEQGFRGHRLTDRTVRILDGIRDTAESLGFLPEKY